MKLAWICKSSRWAYCSYQWPFDDEKQRVLWIFMHKPKALNILLNSLRQVRATHMKTSQISYSLTWNDFKLMFILIYWMPSGPVHNERTTDAHQQSLFNTPLKSIQICLHYYKSDWKSIKAKSKAARNCYIQSHHLEWDGVSASNIVIGCHVNTESSDTVILKAIQTSI